MAKNSDEPKFEFDYLKSKIKELHIPLPNFKYFHKPSSEEEVFENFVGREDISEQLEEWLTNGDSGAYLVTGYRGMGKTSFVGKVLHRITKKNKKTHWFTFWCLLSILSFISGIFLLSLIGKWHLCFIIPILLFALSLIGVSFFILSEKESKKNKKNKNEVNKNNINDTDYQNHKTWFDKIFDMKNIKESKYNLVIKINLGHESLKERDILSLIAKRIYNTYKDYQDDFYTNWIKPITRIFFLFSVAIFFVWCLDQIGVSSLVINSCNSGGILCGIKKLCINLINDNIIIIITKLILSVVFYFIVRRVYFFIVSIIPFFRKSSKTILLNKLKFLIDRIEAAVTENSGPNTGYQHSTSFFSFSFQRRKDKIYPIASTREIEDELIQILQQINTRFLSQIRFPILNRYISSPRFIIVFDELDKIDPVYNQVVKVEQDVPEFETVAAFQGGSAIRYRKQNVLKLLGNMKLFMSQAKAKFVFISGRELYDAFLADLADREFAASSIFNGIIYVDSFLESSTKQKNIITKTEEYICGYLIPEKWYKNEAKQQYYQEKGKETLHKKLDNISYRYPNLRMYKKFLIEDLIDNILPYKNLIGRHKYSSYKEFTEKTKYDRFSQDILDNIEQTFQYIDKIIVFLNQFSIYLTHVCNGSPKKITIYFEQYIKMFIYGHPKNKFSKTKDEAIKGSKYCLSFSAIDQQKIGFIFYMTYPIIQAIINNSSHFGDKMLVSVSFLIDHIFKHHKGGFSHENIEHTPELLEVYHIPHLRTVIDTILSFLKQNHVTDICGGVYQYKFRKSIADEILYNSRVSEEISAIFNFTLDESLPIKRYYYKQIAENEKKYLALEGRIRKELISNQYALTLASQLEILAEIHLLDEEYNEAIQHFQTAFEIIKTELRVKESDKEKLQLYVFLVKTALKLGISNECKGYYNEAFVIYNTLLDFIVNFRNLRESDLGLNYYYEDNNLKDKTGEWKTKKTKIYHNVFGRITSNDMCYSDDNFYSKEVLPFYKQMEKIQDERIDFLFDSDYVISGLSKMLSPEKQEIISRLTLFSEVKPIFQVILANLLIIEKIDLNCITQENLDLAEDQFKYIFLVTDSKDKFIQAADFYKKLASILFLKNYSNPKRDEYLQMWGFDIYETINEFCFINSDRYRNMIAGKFPKEILKEFFIDNINNEDNKLWDLYVKEINETGEKSIILEQIDEYLDKYEIDNKDDFSEFEREITEKEKELIALIIHEFYWFGKKKRSKYFKNSILEKCDICYQYCLNRGKNHPCYACNYVSKSLDIFRRTFEPKVNEFTPLEPGGYMKRKSYFFKFLEYFRKTKTNSNNLFVLASALRIKADISLSCVNGEKVIIDGVDVIDNRLTLVFLNNFFTFLENYYYAEENIDSFIDTIEKRKFSKLEKTILYYWLSAEYFYLNTSLVDSNESLTKILLIIDRYISVGKELQLLTNDSFINPFVQKNDILIKIQETVVRKVLSNSNNTNNDINHIELQNLKFILRYRPTMHLNLSNLSTTANIEDILFSYCKLELNVWDVEQHEDDKSVYEDCYKSTLLSPNRFSFTIHEKIVSLEFKERINSSIFRKIFKKITNHELNFYEYDFQITYFKFLRDYINEAHEIPKEILILLKIHGAKPDIDQKIKVLHFLISDSLFCLTQIIEILSSGKFSNFSNSFIGDVYHQISKWATLYYLTFNILPQNTENKDEINTFVNHEIITMKKRKESIDDIKIDGDNFKKMPEIEYFKENINGIHDDIIKYYNRIDHKITNRIFETNILNDIGTGNRHFLVPNYSVGMALRHYHKTLELHSEGKEYKEMIKKMYIIDDDISNGMHNFSLALERYIINCGLVEKKMSTLRKYYKDSLSYPLENYLKDTRM